MIWKTVQKYNVHEKYEGIFKIVNLTLFVFVNYSYNDDFHRPPKNLVKHSCNFCTLV